MLSILYTKRILVVSLCTLYKTTTSSVFFKKLSFVLRKISLLGGSFVFRGLSFRNRKFVAKVGAYSHPLNAIFLSRKGGVSPPPRILGVVLLRSRLVLRHKKTNNSFFDFLTNSYAFSQVKMLNISKMRSSTKNNRLCETQGFTVLGRIASAAGASEESFEGLWEEFS